MLSVIESTAPQVANISKEPGKPASWLRSKLIELYSGEFKRLKVEFENTAQQASQELEKSKTLNEAIKAETDNAHKMDMQEQLNKQNEMSQGINRKVREMNIRMAVLKTQFEQRLAKVTERESERDTFIETLPNEDYRKIFKVSFDRLSKLLFVPCVDRLATSMCQTYLFGNPIEQIYSKNPIYEPHLGTLLAHCVEYDRFMIYAQKRFVKYMCREDSFEPAVQQFIVGILFRALDGLKRETGCSILSNFKVKDDLIGYDGSVDYAIKIDERVAAYVVKVGLGDGLESGQARLLATMDSSKLSELMLKQNSFSKCSYGIVTSGQYWELIKLNHASGEFSVSETLGPIDITYCEPGLENENVLPLCRNILGMLEEAVKS